MVERYPNWVDRLEGLYRFFSFFQTSEGTLVCLIWSFTFNSQVIMIRYKASLAPSSQVVYAGFSMSGLIAAVADDGCRHFNHFRGWLLIGPFDPGPMLMVSQHNTQVGHPGGIVFRPCEFHDSELLTHILLALRGQVWITSFFLGNDWWLQG